MRYWYDTEFIDDGSTIDLISIGIVAEDGRELYLQSSEFNIDKASQWVKDNVIMHLELCPHIFVSPSPIHSLGTWYGAQAQHSQGQCTFADPTKGVIGAHTDCPWRTRAQIKQEILAFMDIEKYGKPELWAYYADYDHVAFCHLFGTMMELPKGFPMYTMDIKQFCKMLGDPRLPEQGKGEHNALADARWNKTAWEFLWKYYDEAEKARKLEMRYEQSRAI